MSRRDMPEHELHLRILAALTYNADQGKRLLPASAAYLRGQGLRVKTEELEAVLDMRLRNILFPCCVCKKHGLEDVDRETQGPHHEARCPKWRAARSQRDFLPGVRREHEQRLEREELEAYRLLNGIESEEDGTP